MVLDPRSRQKKVERRRAREKARQQAQKERSQRFEQQTMQALPSAPILHCFTSENILDQGMGSLVITRVLPFNRVAYGSFLLDLYCLGVKDADFDIVDRRHYDFEIHAHMTRRFATVPIEPSYARKLIEGGVEYARNLGFSPHPDYADAKLIFGDINAELCERTFKYGKDGKPFFISGPHDGPKRCTQILHTLNERCGPNGFHYIMRVPGSESARIVNLPNGNDS